MLRKDPRLVLALALVLVTVVPVQARDLCLTIPNFFGVAPLVGKGFRVPPRNRCKPFNGFTTAQAGLPTFVVGTGCTSADGFAFHLAFTAHTTTTGNPVTGYCGFILPGLGAGSCVGTDAVASAPSDELFAQTSSASGQACTVDVP
jgi:hypothetical protein